MAQQFIGLGTPNQQDGDFIRDAWVKAQDNFTELYGLQFFTDRIISGSATWTGTGLIFDVIIDIYVFNGEVLPLPNDDGTRSSINTQVTLSVGDATNPRIDVIALDAINNEIVVIPGNPSADPLEPTIDFETQLRITAVTVNANATTPNGVTSNIIFNETGSEPNEWTALESTGGQRINLLSNNNPGVGTVSIETTGILSGDTVTFVNDVSISTSSVSGITFKVLNKTVSSSLFQVQCFSGNTRASSIIRIFDNSYGYSQLNTSTYQTINISSLDLNFGEDQFDKIVITFFDRGFISAKDVFIDDVRFVTGVENPPTGPNGINLINAPNDNGLGANIQVGSNIRDFYVFEDELIFQQGGLDGQYVLQLSDTFKNSINIPTNTSSFINDGSDNTSTYVELDELSTVATTGSYNDLLNLPIIPTNTSDLINDGEDTVNPFITLADIPAPITPTLQEVTDVGNTITNGIVIDTTTPFTAFEIKDSIANKGLYFDNDGFFNIYRNNEFFDIELENQRIIFGQNVGFDRRLLFPAATDNRDITFPDASGTIALTSDIVTSNLQAVTDEGNVTTNNIDVASVNSLELFSQTGIDTNNIAIGLNSLQNNTGITTIGIGTDAGSNNTGISSTFIGFRAGNDNTGTSTTAIGSNSLQDNTGGLSTAIGVQSGQFNTGSSSTLIGYQAGQNNTGSNITAIGVSSGGLNKGSSVNTIGSSSGFRNTGDNLTSFGRNSAISNEGDNNTVIGSTSYNVFNDDISGQQTIITPETNVDPLTERITINSHGFGTNGSYVNLRYNTTGSPIGGLADNSIFQFLIVDSNTIEYTTNIFSTGSNSDTHTLTPQFVYDNVTVLGANAEPTKSNQVTLGDSNITSVRTANTSYLATDPQDFVTLQDTYDRLNENTNVTGTFDLDYSIYETFDLTLTGATTFTESNLPSVGNNKVILLKVTGDFALTYPAGWSTDISGTYDGTVNNTIVVWYINAGEYKVQITQPD